MPVESRIYRCLGACLPDFVGVSFWGSRSEGFRLETVESLHFRVWGVRARAVGQDFRIDGEESGWRCTALVQERLVVKRTFLDIQGDTASENSLVTQTTGARLLINPRRKLGREIH